MSGERESAPEAPTAYHLAAVIVNHEHWATALAQLRAHQQSNPRLFARTEWLLLHNGADRTLPLRDLREESNGEFRPLDPSIARVRVRFCENRGYGSAVNLAFAVTTAPFLLALNADLMPEEGFLAAVFELLEHAQRNSMPRVGILGMRLLNDDGTWQGSVGRFPTLKRLLLGLLRPRAIRKYVAPGPHGRADWVTGACCLLRRECVEALGGFDEGFFMYYEDVDLCLRAWRSGWQVRFAEIPAARHFHPYHARPLTHHMVYMARHSLIRYFRKNRPAWEFWALAAIVRGEAWWRWRDAGWRVINTRLRRVLANPLHEPFDHTPLR